METKKTKKYTIYRFLPMIILMILIFVFSAMPAEESSEQSDFIVELISKSYSGLCARVLSPEALGVLTLIVRKTAHFSEYAILSCTVLFAFGKILVEPEVLYVVSLLISHVYAVSDEIHQYFVPGRCMAYKDVMIDTAGGLTAILIYALIKRSKNKKNTSNN